MKKSYIFASFAMALAVTISACDSSSPLEARDDTQSASAAEATFAKYLFTSPQNDLKDGTFTVCKEASDDVTQAFTFNTNYVLGDPADLPISVVASVDLKHGECEDVYVSVWGPDQVTITEVVPAGWETPDFEVWTRMNDGTVFLDAAHSGSGNSLSGAIEDGKAGCLVIFKNKKEPSGGGQGCTPGYWKNNWDKKGGTAWGPTGVNGNTALSVVGFTGFSVASGDATSFFNALSQGAGGENALMRHAAAAYLNAAHPDISYGMTAGDVVALTNAALASGDAAIIESLKDQFDVANNQGCPLNQKGEVSS